MFDKGLHLRIAGLTFVFVAGLLSIISSGGGDFYISPCFPFPCPIEEPGDTIPPTAPTQLVANAISPSKIALMWQEATDNEVVIRYQIYQDDAYIGMVASSTTEFTSSGLEAVTMYCYHVTAVDLARNESVKSNKACATTLADTTPPTVPASISVTYIETGEGVPALNVTWSQSSDDGLIAGYKLYRDSAYLATVSKAIYTDTDIDPLTYYCYAVLAYDKSGNESALTEYTCATSSWLLSIVRKGEQPESIAIDADGNNKPHMIYTIDKLVYNYEDERYTQNKYLRYYFKRTSSWLVLDLDTYITSDLTNHNKFTYPEIRSDSSDNEHVGYINYTSRELKYIFMGGGYWTRTTVVENEEITGSALDADAGGHAHFSYIGSGDIKYATNRTGVWQTEVIEDTDNLAMYPSITVDQDNNVHISYYDDYGYQQGGAIIYATDASGNWLTSIVKETAADIHYFPSIVSDSAGGVHIIYSDDADNTLVQATKAADTWDISIINDNVDTAGSSVYADSSNSLHVSYVDDENNILMYSTNITGSWKTYAIDARSYVHHESAIAIDTNGETHLGYRGNDDLRYATTQPSN